MAVTTAGSKTTMAAATIGDRHGKSCPNLGCWKRMLNKLERLTTATSTSCDNNNLSDGWRMIKEQQKQEQSPKKRSSSKKKKRRSQPSSVGVPAVDLESLIKHSILQDRPEQVVLRVQVTPSGDFRCVPVISVTSVCQVCQLTVQKCHLSYDQHWSLVEVIPSLHLERTLEDQESVLEVVRSWLSSPGGLQSGGDNQLHLRKDFTKYLLAGHLQTIFPDVLTRDNISEVLTSQSTDTEGSSPPDSPAPHLDSLSAVQQLQVVSDRLTDVSGYLFTKETGKKTWRKVFVVMEAASRNLYASSKPASKESKHLVHFAHIGDHRVYKSTTRLFGAPSDFCFVLKPFSPEKESRIMCAENECDRLMWLTAFRILEHGHKLVDNLKMTLRKQNESRRFSRTSNNSKEGAFAAMDFSGPTGIGRLVHTQLSPPGRDNHTSDNHSTTTTMTTAPPTSSDTVTLTTTTTTPQRQQQASTTVASRTAWYHGAVTGEEASWLLQCAGLVEGVYLVRDSQSTPGCYVLTYVHDTKVKHHKILAVSSPGEETPGASVQYTLGRGEPCFMGLCELVAYYSRCAAGCLPTALTQPLPDMELLVSSACTPTSGNT